MAKVTAEILQMRQKYPLDLKVDMSLNRIKHWYKQYAGNVYVAFSGGKDSTVLLHLVRSLFPEVPAVFVNTGLEYPEINQFVETIDNVITEINDLTIPSLFFIFSTYVWFPFIYST